MTPEQLSAIPRMGAFELAEKIKAAGDNADAIILLLETHANVEWWRGFHAGSANRGDQKSKLEITDAMIDRGVDAFRGAWGEELAPTIRDILEAALGDAP